MRVACLRPHSTPSPPRRRFIDSPSYTHHAKPHGILPPCLARLSPPPSSLLRAHLLRVHVAWTILPLFGCLRCRKLLLRGNLSGQTRLDGLQDLAVNVFIVRPAYKGRSTCTALRRKIKPDASGPWQPVPGVRQPGGTPVVK